MLTSISLVFPAYNEDHNIRRTVESALKVGKIVAKWSEVVVVNDGSLDQTGAIVSSLANGFERVRLINHQHNKGYGQTVWDGLQAATGDWVFYSDADGQFDLNELTTFVQHVETEGVSVVVGYRAPRRDPVMRRVNAWGWGLLVRTLLGVKIRDVDCAFKLISRPALRSVTIQFGGATFSPELMLRLKQGGWTWAELPVSHFPRRAGRQTGASLSVIRRAGAELYSLYRQERRK